LGATADVHERGKRQFLERVRSVATVEKVRFVEQRGWGIGQRRFVDALARVGGRQDLK